MAKAPRAWQWCSMSSPDSPPLTLVPATEADARMAFDWRNDPVVRRYSHDPAELDFADHQRWWRAAVAAPDRDLLLAIDDGVPVGVLRLDRDGDRALVSIYLDPARIGRGLGRRVLDAAADFAAAQGLVALTATIEQANTASQSAFAKAGYVPVGELWIRSLK